MNNRKMRYLLWLGVLIPLEALVIIAEFRSPTVHRGFTALMWAVYWLWNGILLMADLHPEYRKWDRWERQVYGLSFVVLGVCFLPVFIGWITNVWVYCALILLPGGLVALVGRFWYVEKKRNEEYYKNQTEKD
jgi:predicted membrane channel-forming protein YqfA (hemolysin III family)